MGRGPSGGTALLGAIALMLSGALTLAQDPPEGSAPDSAPVREATLRAGNCEAIGEIAAVLAQVAPVASPDATGPVRWVGPPASHLVLVGASEVPLPLEDIAGGGHVIVVGDPEDSAPIACAVVGGPLTEEDRLAVALVGTDDGSVDGIALLTGLGLEATSVELYVVVPAERGAGPVESPLPSLDPGPQPSPEPDPSPEPSASPDGGDDIEPDPDEIGPDPDADVDPGEDIDVDVGPER